MRFAWILIPVLAACWLFMGPARGESKSAPDADTAWLSDKSWDDGAAFVSVFRGRIQWYGEFREAEVRHYVVREFLDPDQLVKSDSPDDKSIPVIKANTLISFNTGTYPYRQMATLFFHRKTGVLVKGMGTSQEGCGTSMQRWDWSGTFRWDTYWDGEARGERALAKPANLFFPEELPFVAGLLKPQSVEVLPPLVRSRIRPWTKSAGELTRDGRTTRIGKSEFRYDAGGFLESWTIPGREEFRRVTKKKLYYWDYLRNGDEKVLGLK
ncbi:MAG: hypothetical protein AAGD14_02160 [Planctomycetota bacterium]